MGARWQADKVHNPNIRCTNWGGMARADTTFGIHHLDEGAFPEHHGGLGHLQERVADLFEGAELDVFEVAPSSGGGRSL